MADENIDTGAAPDTGSNIEQATKDAALVEMSRDENPENYIKEREARDKEEAGEQVNGEDRSARIREALAKARQDTAEARQQNGLDQPDLDHEYQTAEQQWAEAEQSEQTYETEIEQARSEGRFTAVAEELKAVNPQAHQEISGALGALDVMMTPEALDVLRRQITKGNPREAMVMLHRLTEATVNDDGSVAMNPSDKLAYLASMPPRLLEETLSQARTFVQLEETISKKFAARYANQPRRHTKAPEPFKRPSGGANPPQNLERLASRGEAIDDYVKVRRQQLKRGRDE
jgi:hypothetical protein